MTGGKNNLCRTPKGGVIGLLLANPYMQELPDVLADHRAG
jgi:hypothetical protein